MQGRIYVFQRETQKLDSPKYNAHSYDVLRDGAEEEVTLRATLRTGKL